MRTWMLLIVLLLMGIATANFVYIPTTICVGTYATCWAYTPPGGGGGTGGPGCIVTRLGNGSAGSTWVYLVWNSTCSGGGVRYIIYRNGTIIANTTNLYYNDTNLLGFTYYEYIVAALDFYNISIINSTPFVIRTLILVIPPQLTPPPSTDRAQQILLFVFFITTVLFVVAIREKLVLSFIPFGKRRKKEEEKK